MQKLLNSRLRMWRVSALKNFPKFDFHFIRTGSVLPPTLPPGGEEQRLVGIGILIAGDNQRSPRFQTSPNGSQNVSLGIIPIEMMEYTDQRGCVVGLICDQVFNVPKVHVRSFKHVVDG